MSPRRSSHLSQPNMVCMRSRWQITLKQRQQRTFGIIGKTSRLLSGAHCPVLLITSFISCIFLNNVCRDRLSTPRGPCSLPVLREAWVNGVIDENTLVWGQGLADWLPVRNIRTLVPQIRTIEVQAATWLKKTFALKPALANARKQRGDFRPEPNAQVDRMY